MRANLGLGAFELAQGPEGPAAEVRTFVVTNWFTELRARLGGGGR